MPAFLARSATNSRWELRRMPRPDFVQVDRLHGTDASAAIAAAVGLLGPCACEQLGPDSFKLTPKGS
jgi:hypothetical protein